MSTEAQSPYLDGSDAGWRIGRYEGVTSPPACPYPDGTKECSDWWDGFGDATEDMIGQRLTDAWAGGIVSND